MKHIFKQVWKNWTTNLITFFISLVVGVGIFLLVFFLQGGQLVDALNGATIGSLSVLFLGMLMMVAYFGFFDPLFFGTKQLFSMFFGKDPLKQGKYPDYVEGQVQKRDNSSCNFVAVIAAGLTLSISIIVLEIIYHIA